MNKMVISKKDWEENGEEILSHEIGHCRSGHSWDLLFIQLCMIFHWFNPAAWLLKQELQNIHEFEADEYVLNRGINIKQYQLLLIKKAVGTQRFTSMANSFNHSKLKKRITMMLKTKSNPWARLKYVYVLPVSLIVITGFARPEITEPLEKISALKISQIFPEEKILEITDSLEGESGERKLVTTFSKKITVDSSEAEDPLVLVDLIIDPEESLQNLKNEDPESFATFREKLAKAVDENLPEGQAGITMVTKKKDTISDSGEKNSISEISIEQTSYVEPFNKDALVLIDGEEGDFDSLEIDEIESFSVLKGTSATDIYGEKGKNGVYLITLKKSQSRQPDNPDSKEISKLKNDDKGVVWIRQIPSLEESKNALIIIDGEESDLETIPVDEIDSFSVLKGVSGANIYGEKGKNGVILITTKKSQSQQINDSDTKEINKVKNNDKEEFWIRNLPGLEAGEIPLVIIDGEESDFESIPVNEIETFSVLKGATGADIYGEKGKNGVILITTKNI